MNIKNDSDNKSKNIDNKRTRSNRNARSYISNSDYLKNIGQGPTIIIDCDYDDKLSERNIKSLVVQLSLSYSYIRKSRIPLKMIICGISKRLKEGLLKTFANTWLGVELSEESVNKIICDKYLDKNTNYNITYLTADSENVLNYCENDDINDKNKQGFDNKEIFIIGGIIDRNKYKNISKVKAENSNIKTARLPIKESGIMLNSHQVLTINHVIECIVKYNETSDWYNTFNLILPKRKKNSY